MTTTIVSVPLEVPIPEVQELLTRLGHQFTERLETHVVLDRRGGHVDLIDVESRDAVLRVHLQGAQPEPEIPDWVLDAQDQPELIGNRDAGPRAVWAHGGLRP